MEKKIFYAAHAIPGTATLELDPEESYHGVKVLRCRKDENVEVINGKGARFLCQVTIADAKKLRLKVISANIEDRPQDTISIAISILKKREPLEWFLEKAVELGASKIFFITSQYAEKSRLDLIRIQRLAISAMKQSGNTWLPQISAGESFENIMIGGDNGLKYIAHCHDTHLPHLSNALKSQNDVIIFIGPEGDFSLKEIEFARTNGAVEVNLGDLRLRAETAALYALICTRLQFRSI
ncbi:MAG: 16S rRNA (uracil(1498)-N(3))-methyltransferase [Bacteroidota bacterium]|nr:16S rRNA (uracil(1498)-N(3))-methyltransferase [Bacteroidota bacterium]